jgi:hypothetical protein
LLRGRKEQTLLYEVGGFQSEQVLEAEKDMEELLKNEQTEETLSVGDQVLDDGINELPSMQAVEAQAVLDGSVFQTPEIVQKVRVKVGKRFYPFSLKKSKRTLKMPILIGGKPTLSYEAWDIVDYVDTRTGEIHTADELKAHPECPKTLRFAELFLQRQASLASLRPEVRPFALFILNFRNQRRGLTPGQRELAKLYAVMVGRRPSDIRRYKDALDKAGICFNDVMHPNFQLAGTKTTRGEHLGAEVNAAAMMCLLRLRHEQQQGRNTLVAQAECHMLDGADMGSASNDTVLSKLAA